MKQFLGAALIAFTTFAGVSRADLVISAFNTPVTINFDGFTAGGFNPTPGATQLDSDDIYARGFSDLWVGSVQPAFGGSSSNAGDYARGNGTDAASTAGIYNFTNTGSAALGIQPTAAEFGSFGLVRLRLLNQTGSSITDWTISYDLYSRSTSGGTRTQVVSFALSSDDFVSSSNSVSGLSGLAQSTATWSTNSFSSSGLSLSVANNNYVYLQFSSADAGGGGGRPKFALDNITITAVPEPTSVIMFALGFGTLAAAHRRRLHT